MLMSRLIDSQRPFVASKIMLSDLANPIRITCVMFYAVTAITSY